MSYIFIYVDHNWHFYVYKLIISVGNLSILSDFWTRFWPKCSTAVSMATAMQMDERIVDYLVLGPNTQDRKVSAKSVTMRATALCKNLSGYRELLLIFEKKICFSRTISRLKVHEVHVYGISD